MATSLTGWNLSDKTANPTKWTFPEASIPADGYLIVWADEDTAQTSLHANFKLSASGEAVLLSDAGGTNLITFAPAKTYQALVISSLALTTGSTYSVFTGKIRPVGRPTASTPAGLTTMANCTGVSPSQAW